MAAQHERQLARLKVRFHERASQLARLGFLLKGSVLCRYKECSSVGCACHTDPDRRHGPYWQWTSKVKGKTVSRTLQEDQVSRYQQWMDNSKRFEEIVAELYDLSTEADAILRELEREQQEQQEQG